MEGQGGGVSPMVVVEGQEKGVPSGGPRGGLSHGGGPLEEEIVPWCRVRGQGVPREEGLIPRWRVVGKGRVSPLVVGDESPMVEGRGSCREYFWTGSMTGCRFTRFIYTLFFV